MQERSLVIWTFVVSIILGIPIWWKLTEIYRSELPHDEIQSLSFRDFQLEKLFVSVYFIEEEGKNNNQQLIFNEQELNSEIRSHHAKSNSLLRDRIHLNFDLKVKTQTTSTTSLFSRFLDDFQLDDELHKFRGESRNSEYAIYLIPFEDASRQMNKVILGKYRHAFVRYNKKSLQKQNLIHELASVISSSFSPKINSAPEISVAVKPAPEYRFSFSLLNEDSKTQSFSWDFSTLSNDYFRLFFKSMSKIAPITVDSQVLHFANLAQKPHKDTSTNSYFLNSDELSHFVNPFEWKLDFTDTKTNPYLNFVVFIPSASHSPLYIRKKGSSNNLETTNAFIIPQWGGIIILNPNFEMPKSTNNNTKTNGNNIFLDEKTNEKLAQLLMEQMRQLLGISSSQSSASIVVPAVYTGAAEWEFDVLSRRYLIYEINSAISSLQGLSRLVLNQTNMPVLDNIGNLCNDSMIHLRKAKQALQSNDFDDALRNARKATELAEIAFFDPNMLALLYFPDEHKYAIYALPFVPIVYQLLFGMKAEFYDSRKKKT